mmetsp:Transcript_19029/g.48456  ORF Transcript_19029/g.48456 Transcript_19029/m.48456 type:complete len:160 (+) Transcript_19029:1598-2077(+)
MRRNPISPSGIAGALYLFEGAAVLAELDLSLAQGDDAASDRESVSPRVREGVRDGVREGVQEGVREGEREGVREGDGTASDLRRQNDEGKLRQARRTRCADAVATIRARLCSALSMLRPATRGWLCAEHAARRPLRWECCAKHASPSCAVGAVRSALCP